MKIGPTLLIVTSSLSMTDAAILARWTPVSTALPGGVNYDNAADMPPADEVGANLTVSFLDRIGLDAGGNAGAVWPGRAAPGTSTIDPAIYTTFTLTPDSGFTLDLDTVTYDYQSYGLAANGYNFYIRSSVDGFAGDIDTSSNTAGAARVTFDVSSLTGLTDPTELRIYATSIETGNRWFDLQGTDVATDVGLIVNGTVTPIPEPSTGLLAALAGLGLMRRRR